MTQLVRTQAQPQLVFAAADPTHPRIDLVVYRDGEVRVVTGVPAATPAPPPLPDGCPLSAGWIPQATVRIEPRVVP